MISSNDNYSFIPLLIIISFIIAIIIYIIVNNIDKLSNNNNNNNYIYANSNNSNNSNNINNSSNILFNSKKNSSLLNSNNRKNSSLLKSNKKNIRLLKSNNRKNIGLVNEGNTCYFNTFIQFLYHDDIYYEIIMDFNLKKEQSELKEQKKEEKHNLLLIINEIKKIFGIMDKSNKKKKIIISENVENILNILKKLTEFKTRGQKDSLELFYYIIKQDIIQKYINEKIIVYNFAICFENKHNEINDNIIIFINNHISSNNYDLNSITFNNTDTKEKLKFSSSIDEIMYTDLSYVIEDFNDKKLKYYLDLKKFDNNEDEKLYLFNRKKIVDISYFKYIPKQFNINFPKNQTGKKKTVPEYINIETSKLNVDNNNKNFNFEEKKNNKYNLESFIYNTTNPTNIDSGGHYIYYKKNIENDNWVKYNDSEILFDINLNNIEIDNIVYATYKKNEENEENQENEENEENEKTIIENYNISEFTFYNLRIYNYILKISNETKKNDIKLMEINEIINEIKAVYNNNLLHPLYKNIIILCIYILFLLTNYINNIDDIISHNNKLEFDIYKKVIINISIYTNNISKNIHEYFNREIPEKKIDKNYKTMINDIINYFRNNDIKFDDLQDNNINIKSNYINIFVKKILLKLKILN
jgi:hypothetical protein